VQHPRANGQAEKAVDTVKQALRKMCLQKHRLDDWDTDVVWLCLGYNCSPHSSHSFTPYELMYARQPIVPPAVSSSISQPLAFDDPASAAADLLARKQLVQQRCWANLRIAQHRDQRRYEVVRSGQSPPRIYRFIPGNYVYTQQHQRHTTLQPRARQAILRVSQVC
jgi:lysozyme family protein